MRDSKIIKDNYNSKPEIIKIDDMPYFDIMEYDLMDEKDFKHYIIDIKREIHNSIEYRRMVKFMREFMDMDRCAFYENVTNAETFRIKIEIHHHPFTIEDIIRIVVKKRMACGEDLDIDSVAYEVMFLHYNGLVGLIPLSATVHELVHNKYLFVPLDRVYGYWEDFYNMYFEYMDEGLIELVRENKEKTLSYDEKGEIDVLKQKHIYLNTEALYNMPNTKEMIRYMQNKINDIKNNNSYDPPKRKMLSYKNEKSNNSIF